MTDFIRTIIVEEDEDVLTHCKKIYLGKIFPDLGFVQKIDNVDILAWKITMEGNIEYKVKITVTVFLPQEGSILPVKVTDITPDGMFSRKEGIISIIIKDVDNSVKLGDMIKVRLTKILWVNELGGYFTCEADQLPQ